MIHNRSRARAIWQEAYEEHGQRQDDAVRATLEAEDAGEMQFVSHEEVIAKLKQRITSRAQPIERQEPEWTDKQWETFFHGLETQQYHETVTTIQDDFAAAQTFDTAALNLTTTPTCVFALYVAARRSATVEEFSSISQEMAKVFKYDG